MKDSLTLFFKVRELFNHFNGHRDRETFLLPPTYLGAAVKYKFLQNINLNYVVTGAGSVVERLCVNAVVRNIQGSFPNNGQPYTQANFSARLAMNDQYRKKRFLWVKNDYKISCEERHIKLIEILHRLKEQFTVSCHTKTQVYDWKTQIIEGLQSSQISAVF